VSRRRRWGRCVPSRRQFLSFWASLLSSSDRSWARSRNPVLFVPPFTAPSSSSRRLLMPLPMSCRLTTLLKALLLSRATCRRFRWRGVRSLAEGLGLLVQGLSPCPGERLEKRDSFRTGHGIHFVVVQGADVVATVPSVLALAHGLCLYRAVC